jgi:coenzyme F420-0:L-glutamate ligase/coenzyme F420-1:gamma-L-glutamate ligase
MEPEPGETVEIHALEGIGEVSEGDAVGALVAEAAEGVGRPLADDDVVVVSQKVVSKAEGRTRSLTEVKPGERAAQLASDLDRDPRLVELVLMESRRVVRADPRVLITEHNSGWICANSGIDSSNAPDPDSVILLPEDSDASARRIRSEIESKAGVRPGVIVADTFGRPWRIGQTDVAIGAAGVRTVDDWVGRDDAYGRELKATQIATADELAAAASLARAKDSGQPVAVIRGAAGARTEDDGPGAAATIQRSADDDLFR